jgi:hypothetical protein
MKPLPVEGGNVCFLKTKSIQSSASSLESGMKGVLQMQEKVSEYHLPLQIQLHVGQPSGYGEREEHLLIAHAERT